MSEILVVRLHNRVVGQLRRGENPSLVSLTVDESFDTTLPTLTASFATQPGDCPSDSKVSNFLGGYMPEGRNRSVMASRRRVGSGDLFALLREFGGSLAGAVTVCSPEGSGQGGWLEEMSQTVVADRLRRALQNFDQGVPDDGRSTLPGFQPKMLRPYAHLASPRVLSRWHSRLLLFRQKPLH